MFPSTSKVAPETRRAQEQEEVQETKFPGVHRSFGLPEHSHDWQQEGIQAADDSQSHSGSQAGKIRNRVVKEGAEYAPKPRKELLRDGGEGHRRIFTRELSKEGAAG